MNRLYAIMTISALVTCLAIVVTRLATVNDRHMAGVGTCGPGTNADRVNMVRVSGFSSPKIELKSHQNETLG